MWLGLTTSELARHDSAESATKWIFLGILWYKLLRPNDVIVIFNRFLSEYAIDRYQYSNNITAHQYSICVKSQHCLSGQRTAPPPLGEASQHLFQCSYWLHKQPLEHCYYNLLHSKVEKYIEPIALRLWSTVNCASY